MRLTESTRNASSSAVEAVVAGFPLAALIRLISSWSYPMPLRDEGAVAGKTITSNVSQLLALDLDFLDDPQRRLRLHVAQPHSRYVQRDVFRQYSAKIPLLH